MSIVKMKRIRLIALAEDKDALLSSLLHAGCVELREPGDTLADENYAALLHRDGTHLAQAKSDVAELQHAMEALSKYAPGKKKLLSLSSPPVSTACRG